VHDSVCMCECVCVCVCVCVCDSVCVSVKEKLHYPFSHMQLTSHLIISKLIALISFIYNAMHVFR
jgi:hypothetical protein